MNLLDLFQVNKSALGQGGAPTYDMNTPLGQQLLQMTLGAGGSGQKADGVEAFLSNKYQPNYARTSLAPVSGGTLATNQGQNYSSLFNLGQALGYKGDTAAMNQVAGLNRAYDPSSGGAGKLDPNTGLPIGPTAKDYDLADLNMQKHYAGLDNYLKDFSTISGMSSGWDGSKNNPRAASSTLYRNNGNNVLEPVSSPTGYTARERGNWFQENPEFMSILSVMLPAVGGWAGLANLAGAGVSGASAAGVNAAGGALMGAATGGTNGALTGLAGSLGGYAGGQAAGALGGSQFAGVGSQLGSQLGKTLAQQNLPAQPGINPGTNPWAGMQIAGQPTKAENDLLAWNNRF